MSSTALRAKLAARQPVLNAWLCIPSSLSAEVVANSGFDCVTVDLQHGMIDFAVAMQMLQAIDTTDTVALARVPVNDGAQIMKLLDAGADGIVCPMVNDGEECARFVSACRYPPVGQRSFGPGRAAVHHGPGYFEAANGVILTVAMIETAQALNNLDAILAVEGLDAVLVGPNDLSLALGHRPASESDEPEVEQAIERVAARSREHGVASAIYCSGVAGAHRRIAQGFDIVTPFTDVGALVARAGEVIGALHG